MAALDGLKIENQALDPETSIHDVFPECHCLQLLKDKKSVHWFIKILISFVTNRFAEFDQKSAIWGQKEKCTNEAEL